MYSLFSYVIKVPVPTHKGAGRENVRCESSSSTLPWLLPGPLHEPSPTSTSPGEHRGTRQAGTRTKDLQHSQGCPRTASAPGSITMRQTWRPATLGHGTLGEMQGKSILKEHKLRTYYGMFRGETKRGRKGGFR